MAAGLLWSAFALALFGGFHCAAMCGGIALAIEQQVMPLRRVSPLRLFGEQLVMHLGRITTYALLGAAAGGLGATLLRASALPVQRGAYAVGSTLLLLYALVLVGGRWRWQLGWLEAPVQRGLGWLQRTLAAPLALLWPPDAWPKRFVVGLGWGLVPCGMIYGALPLALLAGSAATGAMTMAAFGAGTLPALLVMSGAGRWFHQWSRSPAARIAAACVIAGFGVAGWWRLLAGPALGGVGLCMAS